MKKIINEANNVVQEMLDGFVGAHDKYYKKLSDVNGVIYKQKRIGKVAFVIGGGSGHEPMFCGFVGKGLADAAACGNIFASPDPGTIYETAKAVDSGMGVLFSYGNYAGDNLNFDMAEELLADEGIKTAHVRVWDDCISAPMERISDRRGVAGDVFVFKIAGAACDLGYSLEEVTTAAEKARDNTRSVGIATSPATIPGLEKSTFELGPNEIEFGMGLHGEPGVMRTVMQPADDIADTLFNSIIQDMPLAPSSEVCVLVNGLGSTSILEMSIIYRRIKQLLDEAGVVVYDADINSYCTCQEMGGLSVTIMKLDDELKKLYDWPCYTPYYAKEGK
jgi:dihydroxyacetone kinase